MYSVSVLFGLSVLFDISCLLFGVSVLFDISCLLFGVSVLLDVSCVCIVWCFCAV